jgi:hypothetical protein
MSSLPVMAHGARQSANRDLRVVQQSTSCGSALYAAERSEEPPGSSLFNLKMFFDKLRFFLIKLSIEYKKAIL